MNEKTIYFSHGIERDSNFNVILDKIMDSMILKISYGSNQRQSKLSVVYGRLHRDLKSLYNYYKKTAYKFVLVFDLDKILINNPNIGVKIIDYNYDIPNPPTIPLKMAYNDILINMGNLPYIGIDGDFHFKKDELIEIIIINHLDKLYNNITLPYRLLAKIIIKIFDSEALEEEKAKTKEEAISSHHYDIIYSLLSSIERNYYGDMCSTYLVDDYTNEKNIQKSIDDLTIELTNFSKLIEKDKISISKFLKEFLNDIIPSKLELYQNHPEKSYCFLLKKANMEALEKKKTSVIYISKILIPIISQYISN